MYVDQDAIEGQVQEHQYLNSNSTPNKNQLQRLPFKTSKDKRNCYYALSMIVLVICAIYIIQNHYRTPINSQQLVKEYAQQKEKEREPQTASNLQPQPNTHNSIQTNTTPIQNSPYQVKPIPYDPNQISLARFSSPATPQQHTTPARPQQHTTSLPLQSTSTQQQSQVGSSNKLLVSAVKGRVIAGVNEFQRQLASKWRNLKDEQLSSVSELAQSEIDYYQQKYNISKVSNELPFCLVVPSHNNNQQDRHMHNIKSIVMQNYSNYHIVFIDDASSDGTGIDVQRYLKEQTKIPPQRLAVIKNQEQKRAMPNLRMAAKEYCKPQQVFMIVDGDDQLIGRQVLKLFNFFFQNSQAWFVYSNFLNVRGYVGFSRSFPNAILQNHSFRNYPFVTSHLRAFYTQLFLNIRDQDLQDQNGSFLTSANDVAICLPILEQAGMRIKYVPELTYYYNSNTGQNNHVLRLKEQRKNDSILRKRKVYKALKELKEKAEYQDSNNK